MTLNWETLQISSVERRNPLDEGIVVKPNRDKREEPIVKDKMVLEVTINHPRTKPFVRMTPARQRDYLTSIYYKMRSTLTELVVEDVFRFEFCKDGEYHLHAIIHMLVPKPYYPQGIVMQSARVVIHAMPKRTHAQLSNYHYNSRFKVFKSPAVLIQLTPGSDIQRIADWGDYINKNQ